MLLVGFGEMSHSPLCNVLFLKINVNAPGDQPKLISNVRQKIIFKKQLIKHTTFTIRNKKSLTNSRKDNLSVNNFDTKILVSHLVSG